MYGCALFSAEFFMSKHHIIFDFETAALPYADFDEAQREYLVRGATIDEEKDKKIGEMALSPLTAKIVCVGLIIFEETKDNDLVEVFRGAFVTDDSLPDGDYVPLTTNEGGIKIVCCNERSAIQRFWNALDKYKNAHLISFNGRNFDSPFIMLRSALLRLHPSRNLMEGSRFNYRNHTDLIDELTFYERSSYGPMKRYNFDFYTKAFGITSPKSEGVDGSKVGELYAQGQLMEIAEYCLRDVQATWELYCVWAEYLKFSQ